MLIGDVRYILNSYQARGNKSKIIFADKDIITSVLSLDSCIPAYSFKTLLNKRTVKRAPSNALCLCFSYFWIELPFSLDGVMFSPREYKKYLLTELKRLPERIATGAYL
ncbi:MAG: hypothetical protein WC307_06630 [Candidatus Nanoarchaeia archaeon]